MQKPQLGQAEEKEKEVMPKLIINEPPQRNQSVGKFWLVICVDKEGNESPCGVNTGSGWLMLGTSNPEMLGLIRAQAKDLGTNATMLGHKIVLREFHDSTDLEEFH